MAPRLVPHMPPSTRRNRMLLLVFFNSLNSIAQLTRVDPEKAEACVERLAEIFRYILHRAEQEFVPLSEELQMLRW